MRIVGNNPQLSRQTQATASGAITGGKPVIVNTDGTVSITTSSSSVTQSLGSETTFTANSAENVSTVFDSNAGKIVIAWNDNGSQGTARVGTISGTSISYGTAVAFESANSQDITTAFDSNSNRVVISYRDYGNSQYGTAIVGTVSGTDISFGSPVVYESASAANSSIAFDSSNNKVVIVYFDEGNSNYGKAIVGTVSGTSISFGSAATYESATTAYHDVTFDSSNNRMVIVYQDTGNSSRGTVVIGTVSGTSISYGTPAVFESGSAQEMEVAFDSNSNRVVIVYRDGNNSNYGTALVGAVDTSDNSISFGTAVVYHSGTIGANLGNAIAFDNNVNKVVVAFVDGSDSNHGKFVVGTVDSSDNSISFTSATDFNSASTTLYAKAMSVDTTNNRVVLGYRDDGNSTYGTAIVLQVAGTATAYNLTTENFIGFAEDTVATGQPVTINTKGAIDENQSSLTPAQQYFVQTDGTLGTSADDPSVVAGTAVTATKLIVKG